jgi:transposase
VSKRPDNTTIVDAFEKTFGIKTAAAQRLGVSRRTIYRWFADDDELRMECEQAAAERTKDAVESKLFQLIEKGNPKAIMYWLDRKARDRGYGVKVDVTHNKEPVVAYVPENGR